MELRRNERGQSVLRRTLEAIFRHPLQLLALIVLLPIIGVAVVYFVIPRTYQSTASVWALQRYFVIGSTGPESDLLSTPAQTQANALTELLQTRSFVDSVLTGIDLAPTLNLGADVLNNPQQLEETLFSEVSKHVVVTPSAYNLFEISYANHNPKIAQQIVASIITNYGTQSLALSVAEGKNLLANYQTQLANAQDELTKAVTAETQFAHTYPNLTQTQLANDPQYAFLDTQRLQAQVKAQNLQNTINTIQQAINTQGTQAGTLFQVIDAPQVPYLPVSRTKNYLIGGGMGLAVALLACVLYLVIVVRRDRGVYSASDLQDFVAFPVILQVPNLTPATVSLLTTNKMQDQVLLAERKSSTNGHMNRS
jgi:uncharacterized protein involved in exopolysaccharide biosynthesis